MSKTTFSKYCLPIKIKISMIVFSIRAFFHGHWRLTGQHEKEGKHILFPSTTLTRSQTFRQIFASLHVLWLPHILDCTAFIYQAATGWDLPPYRITIWLFDDVILNFVCLLDDLILGFYYSSLRQETGLELDKWTD